MLSLRQAADTHFYTDDEIFVLMRKYLGANTGNLVLDSMTIGYNDNLQGLQGSLLNHRAIIMEAAAQNRRVFIPVNVGNVHWNLVILDYSNGINNQQIFHVDPMGSSNIELERMIISGLSLPASTRIESIQNGYQQDHFNCGPWIIELAKYFATNGVFPTPGTIDINVKPREHHQFYRSREMDNPKSNNGLKFFDSLSSVKECVAKFNSIENQPK